MTEVSKEAVVQSPPAPRECEYSKPAYQGAEHYRICLADLSSVGCSEKAWKENSETCPYRKQAINKQVPLPTPEQLKPEPIKWQDVSNAQFRGN